MSVTAPFSPEAACDCRNAAEDALSRFAGLPEITWTTFEWFLSNGVPATALVYPELPRRARVSFHRDQPFFDFADDVGEEGEDAVIFLCRNIDGDEADLVAWGCGSRQLAAHWGAVDVLGAEGILAPRLTLEAALPVHRTPLDWLKAERQGVVIIGAMRAAVALRDFGPLAAEDEAHGRELEEIFRQTAPVIYVPERRLAA